MTPPAGAGPLSVTVPVEDDPPTTVVGARATLLSAPTAATVSTAVFVIGPETAEIVAVVVLETATVVIGNVADEVPTPTVTDVGRVATELSELSVTTFPPVGAWPLSVTVPVDGLPPIRVAGASVKVVNAAGTTVRNALIATPPEAAETLTFVVEETGRLVTVKVPVLKPAATVNVEGTVAAEVLELDSVTIVPPAGALPTRVTVPVAVAPLMTRLGATVRALTAERGMTVRAWDRITLPWVAVIVIEADEATWRVVIAKFAEPVPADTVTLAGTVAMEVSELDSETTKSETVLPERVIVPVAGLPPPTLVGLIAKIDSAAGVTVSVADFVTPW
jgi:hypothetical protein